VSPPVRPDVAAGPAPVAPAGAARSGLLRRLAAPAGVAVLAAGATAVVGTVDPNQAGHYPTCPFLFVTGLYCPGCGSLRAVHALAHLDVATAVDRNPLLVATLPFLVVAWVAWLRRRVTGRPRRTVLPAAVVHTILAVVVGYWVLRNVPALEWLAP
jgi:Protein of unknown function (DUF2752)